MLEPLIDWLRLRPFGGSQELAFEEVCKQIFGAECRAAGARWIPTGRIDAGVEGYGVMPDASEWGVQAKWFLTAPTTQQWGQVDDSVTSALERHPRLTRYVVCMPHDLSDARTPGTTSSRARWEARRAQYSQWATDRGMSAGFEFWGSHELAERLMQPRMRGLRAYWFGGPEFSQESVQRRIEDTLSAVGPRYSKTLNVDVPLSRFVDAITLSKRFVERVFELYRAVSKSSSSVRSKIVRDTWSLEADEIADLCGQVRSSIEPLADDCDAPIAWDAVAMISRKAAAKCRDLSGLVRKAGDEVPRSKRTSSDLDRNPYEHDLHDLWKLTGALGQLATYAKGIEARLSRAPYMLLVGEAGSGKTHFLCDMALREVEAGNIVILDLGREDFDTRGVWHDVTRGTALPADADTMLGALQSVSEATGTRALVLIDAINEGPSQAFWLRELSVIINQIKRYPRVGIIVSVRDTFLDTWIREDAHAEMLEVRHEGFAYDVIDAQRAFFRNFKIREPAVPLLLPEFANPLFLKLFCSGIVAAGLSEVPRGLSGITGIFEFFVDALNKKISADLDVDPHDQLVGRALNALSAALTPERPNTLDRPDAKKLVDEIYRGSGHSRSLFAALEHEGLITTTLFGDEAHVRFTYERIADHARASRLLNSVSTNDAADPSRLQARLLEIVPAATARYRDPGLFDALMIQVPERYNREILQVVPAPNRWDFAIFLRSLPWRRPDSIGPAATRAVFRLLEREPELRDAAVECLLSCALIPENPLNAEGLDAYLRDLTLARRDVLWTIPISQRHDDSTAVMRLIGWAREGAFGLSDVVAESAAIVLLWLCSSTNRYVRDNATKGVVVVLDAAPPIPVGLFERFRDCNDPYVTQRLYAALGGHAMRTNAATVHLTHLARAVLRAAEEGRLPVDILARDFARTIVERARMLRAIPGDTDTAAVTPPYGSAPPDWTPADKDLFERHSWSRRKEQGDADTVPRAMLHLHSSLDTHGDFSRYVVGTNGHGDWLATRLSEARPLSREEQRSAIAASLTPSQMRLYRKFVDAQRASSAEMRAILFRAIAPPLSAEERAAGVQPDTRTPVEPSTEVLRVLLSRLTADQADASENVARAQGTSRDHDADREGDVTAAKRHFIASLDEPQMVAYRRLENTGNDFERYDLRQGTQWMFRRVLDIGYGGAEMYEFDEQAARDAWDTGRARQPATIERIGKKYQWIAYFEFSARMADNYHLEGWRTDGAAVRYDVPAQVVQHDIDPSLLLTETCRPGYDPHQQTWWAGPSYQHWQEEVPAESWIRDAGRLPDPLGALLPIDGSGTEWVCLNTHLSWRQPDVLLEDRYDVPRRELWYLLFGYLVPKTEAQRAYRWLRRQNFSGRWLRPQPHDAYHLLWGELFWAPAFTLESSALSVPPDSLDNLTRKATKDLLIPATGAYMHERGTDNSVTDSIRIGFPIAEIVRGVGAIGSEPERGAWIDATGRTVCIDPSAAQPGSEAVLVRRECLEQFLRDSPYSMVWTLLSEKQVVGGDTFGTHYGRLVTSGAYWLREATDGSFSLVGGLTPRFEG